MPEKTPAELLSRGIEAARSGRFDAAVADFEALMAIAKEAEDQPLRDRAFCNLCGVRVEAGLSGSDLNELRRIMMRTRCAESSFLAAYNISRAYELQGKNQRSLFYARVARDRTASIGRDDWLCWSNNQIGNLLLAKGDFVGACEQYEEALERFPAKSSLELAVLFDNLGYCRTVQGRTQEGFGLLYRSLRMLRRLGAERFEAPPRLALCYAYLEVGKLRAALRQGLRAFEIASEVADQASLKYAHFLLGEVYGQLDCSDVAYDHFRRLQQRFYPDNPNIPDLLMAVDVRSMINLKA